jgi:large subunit ribosomal protein L10
MNLSSLSQVLRRRSGVPKPENIAAVAEIKEKLDSSAVAILTEFQGLDVAEMTELRKLFREANVDYKVYKNTLTSIAAQQLNVAGVDEYLIGTTALATSREDPVAPAKIAKDFSAKHENFKIKVGILNKKLIASDDVTALASIPPKEVLLGMVLGGMQAPISGFLRVLQGPIQSLVFALKDLANQKDKGESAEE